MDWSSVIRQYLGNIAHISINIIPGEKKCHLLKLKVIRGSRK